MLMTKMLVTEMVWIGACDEDGVDLDQEGELIQIGYIGREMGIEREQHFRKNG